MLFSSGTADAKLGIGLSEYALVYNGASLDRCILSFVVEGTIPSFARRSLSCSFATAQTTGNRIKCEAVSSYGSFGRLIAPGPGQQQLCNGIANLTAHGKRGY